MSDTRRAQDNALQEEINTEHNRGKSTWWRDYLARTGRGRVLDWWVTVDVAQALHEINLNRWRGDTEVAEAVREARAAMTKLSAAMSRARRLR